MTETPDEDGLIVPDYEGVPVDDSAEPGDANADHEGPDDYLVIEP